MKRLVLAGAGHSHARVLLEFARRAVPGLEIVLISPFAEAPYSGMIPGWMAGYYRWQDCCIDFARLCHRANARFIADTVIALDPDRCVLALAGGGSIGYDRLSIDIGSTMNAPSGDGLAALPLRPLGNLHQLWKNIQEKVRVLDADAHCRIVVVGGGAAGVESIMAARQRLMRIAPHVRFHFTLASAAHDILPGMADGAARRLKRRFIERGSCNAADAGLPGPA
jgi:NADH dehydrogenase FAD-containing subunit